MSWISKLFGNCGTVKFKGMTIDGCSFNGKVHIESLFNTEEEIIDDLKKLMYKKYGKTCSTLKIIDFIED